MPQLSFSLTLAANQLGLLPLTGWQYEFAPFPARLVLLLRSTATGSLVTVYSGSETVQERSPIQAGGTAGVTPSELNTPPTTWIAAGNDRLKVQIDNTTAGAMTIDGLIVIQPLG
jgi:hypothetical protein